MLITNGNESIIMKGIETQLVRINLLAYIIIRNIKLFNLKKPMRESLINGNESIMMKVIETQLVRIN